MEKEQWFGQIMQNMKEIGSMDMLADKAHSIMLTKTRIVENGKIISVMGMGNIRITRMQNILAIGKMTVSMDKA